ncbi:MAG: riboflavin kinase, partial [Candidatus Uhrbacteria bacterium]|nr:riboflavin kinase [Candidatus Uhrbacteria bacterium]
EYQSVQTPERGVWVCRVRIESREYQGLAVIGMWKFENHLPSVEVHLLDFDQDLYDQTLVITLEMKLRDVKIFTDMSKLLSQIEQDVKEAHVYFSS